MVMYVTIYICGFRLAFNLRKKSNNATRASPNAYVIVFLACPPHASHFLPLYSMLSIPYFDPGNLGRLHIVIHQSSDPSSWALIEVKRCRAASPGRTKDSQAGDIYIVSIDCVP